MKTNKLLSIICINSILFFIIIGCEKTDKETDFENTDNDVIEILTLNTKTTDIAVEATGYIISDLWIDTIGIVYSSEPNPTIETGKYKYADEYFYKSFAFSINDLIPNSSYYIKTFAVNDGNYSYSEEIEIVTHEAYSFELRYVSGNGQCFSGGGLPEHMMFLVQDKKTNTTISDLDERNLSIISSSTLGVSDSIFFTGIVDYCPDCYLCSVYIDDLNSIDTSITTFWVNIDLLENGVKIDSLKFHHYIADVENYLNPNEY